MHVYRSNCAAAFSGAQALQQVGFGTRWKIRTAVQKRQELDLAAGLYQSPRDVHGRVATIRVAQQPDGTAGLQLLNLDGRRVEPRIEIQEFLRWPIEPGSVFDISNGESVGDDVDKGVAWVGSNGKALKIKDGVLSVSDAAAGKLLLQASPKQVAASSGQARAKHLSQLSFRFNHGFCRTFRMGESI